MNKKIIALSALVLTVALFFSVGLTRFPEKSVIATNDTHALGENLSIIGGDGLGDILGGVGDGDILGGIGDVLEGLGGRLTTGKSTTERITYNIETIVPLITKQELSTIFEQTSESTTQEAVTETQTQTTEESTTESTEPAAYSEFAPSTQTSEATKENDSSESTFKIIAIVVSVITVWALVIGCIIFVVAKKKKQK